MFIAGAILAATNNYVNAINSSIQNKIPGETFAYKSIVTDELKRSRQLSHRILEFTRFARYATTHFVNHVIDTTILNGKLKGDDVLLPRIAMIPTNIPFEFKRLQFSVRLAFTLTINKAQGQSLQVCGLDLENPCFSHGQLYVANSRVGKPSNLVISYNQFY